MAKEMELCKNFCMDFHVGTSGFSYKAWKGSFYPRSLKAGEMLRFYGEQFRSVEINNTFYRMPKADLLTSWARAVPDDFRFALKAPREITHVLKLAYVERPLTHLLEVTSTLEDRLGPVLFQLPPRLKMDRDRLGGFLALLPAERLFAFEFRDPSWYEDEVFQLLHDHGAALCVSHSGESYDAPFVSTADWGYLRLRQPGYRDEDLKTWIQRALDQEWREAYVFFKHERDAPETAARFQKLIMQAGEDHPKSSA